MTTAARPTFEPAKGGMGRGERDLSALSKQYSSRDLASHTKLKYREHGQGTTEEIRGRDFRRELEDREREVQEKRSGTSRSTRDLPPQKKPRLESAAPTNLDADDPQDEDTDSDSDSDDETHLMLELENLKRDKADEYAQVQKKKAEQEERIRMENIVSGNPLLALDPKADMKIKRRWDDDVVFKNCASSEAKKPEKAFINDSLRSEFHKKFMEKYIK